MSLRMACIRRGVVCSRLELPRNLPSWHLAQPKITLTLGSNRISRSSLSDDSVFMLLQKPGTLNQTTDSLQWAFMCIAVWVKKHTVCYTAVWNATLGNSGSCAVESGGTGDAMVVTGVGEACGAQGTHHWWVRPEGGVQQPGVSASSAVKHAAQLHNRSTLSHDGRSEMKNDSFSRLDLLQRLTLSMLPWRLW